ncbi:MAG: zinc-binding alcohol dehydrogenase [Armatimonadetes bacterium]|nr:zinc-binding alcohol dehydrogenase [Armatimonadota bacterium]
MPLALLATGMRQPELREYDDRPPGPGEVLIRSVLSAEKHGTDLLFYRGESPFTHKTFDGEHGLFMPREGEARITPDAPMPLGNMTVGVVTEVGPEVADLPVGTRVYGYLPIRETHTVSARAVRLAPEGLTAEMLVCLDPALVALLGVREGRLQLGDTVAIFGMGAIGLMAVGLARLAGAAQVIAVEPLPLRAELARRRGADLVLDPRADPDVGLRIREATGMAGVDAALETSGSHAALHHAIRGACYGGAIVTVAWYHGGAAALELGEEWHFNRQTLVSGARLESVPYRDHPRWDPDRVERTVIDLFARGQLAADDLLQPRVPISEAAEAYRLVDEHPERCVKLAVEYR